MRTIEFKEDVIREAFERFFNDRIVFICAAGSIVHGRATPTSDLDLMLVLDTYHADDLYRCRNVARVLREYYYLVGISLQYADEVPKRPEDVQDGSKSSLALTYINSAYVIAGENIFKDLFLQLPVKDLQRSIIRALEEYLHRMYTVAFNSTDDDPEFKDTAFKFLTRAMIDAMLYYHQGDMGPYDKLTKLETLELLKNEPEIRRITADVTVDTLPTEMVKAIRAITVQLKKDYGIL